MKNNKACILSMAPLALIITEIIFFLAAVITIPAYSQEEAKDLRILTDGKELSEVYPVRIKDKLYLPLEPIAKALGIAVTFSEKTVVVNGRAVSASAVLYQNLHYIPRNTLQNVLGVRAYVMRDENILYVMSPWYEYNYFARNAGKSGTQQGSSTSGGSPGGKPAGSQSSAERLEIVNHRVYGEFSQNQGILVDVTVQNNTNEPQQNVTVLFQVVGIRDRNNYEKKTFNYYGKIEESIPAGSRRSGTIRLSLRNLSSYRATGAASGEMTIDIIGQSNQQIHEYHLSIEGQK
ncbi:MAG: hypothetical protein AB2L14_23515 [Candidatus Xenobiia bacterium LiM19]